MEIVTLILPLEATTVNNPSNSSGVTAVAIAGATAAVQQWSDSGAIAMRQQSNNGGTV